MWASLENNSAAKSVSSSSLWFGSLTGWAVQGVCAQICLCVLFCVQDDITASLNQSFICHSVCHLLLVLRNVLGEILHLQNPWQVLISFMKQFYVQTHLDSASCRILFLPFWLVICKKPAAGEIVKDINAMNEIIIMSYI